MLQLPSYPPRFSHLVREFKRILSGARTCLAVVLEARTMGQAAAKISPPSASLSPAPSLAKSSKSSDAAPSTDLRSSTGGQPIVPSTRARMERAFGRSFEDVRVHTDAGATEFAKEHQAEAVTHGRDIAFGASRYRPGTQDGDRLLAHELAHVVQQGSTAPGLAQARREVSTPNEPAEVQAEAAASRVMSGQPAGVSEGGFAWSTVNRLMRKALTGAGAAAPSVPVPIPGHAAVGTTSGAALAVLRKKKRKLPDGMVAARAGGSERMAGDVAPARGGEEPAEESVAEVRPRADLAVDHPPGESSEPSLEGGTGETIHHEAAADRSRRAGEIAPSRPRGLALRLVAKAQQASSPTAATAQKSYLRGGSEPGLGLIAGKNAEAAVIGTKNSEARAGETTAATDGKPGTAVAGTKTEGSKAAETTGAGEGAVEATKGEPGVGAPRTAMDIEATTGAAAPAAAKGEARTSAQVGERPGAAKEHLSAGAGPAMEQAVADTAAGPTSAGTRESASAGGGAGAGMDVAGGDSGGGAGGAEAETIEEQLADKQPEEEKAAEAEQDADMSESGGGAESEAADEPVVGPEPPGAESEGGADARPDLNASEAGSTAAAEQKLQAKQAPALAKAEQQAKEDEAAEAGHEDEQQSASSPDAAGGEDGQLSPAEESAATAAVSQDVGGGGAGGGGGGGGGAVPDKPAPLVPDVSGSEPKAALSSLQGQAPMAIKGALTGVSSAVSKSIGDRSQALAASPPTRAASTGMPGKQGSTSVELGGGETKPKVEKVATGAEVATKAAEPVPEAPPVAVDAVAAPTVSDAGEGGMSAADAARMGSAIDSLPTTDPGMVTTAGPPPTVALEGNADPARVTSQRAKTDEAVAAAHEAGKFEAQKPLGEDEIAPRATNETLAAKVPTTAGGGGGGAVAGGGGGGVDEEVTSIIAQEKSQSEIDAAVAKGRGDMAQEEAKEKQSSQTEKLRSSEAIVRAESETKAQQEAAKVAAKKEVARQRGDWSGAQQAAVDKSSTAADATQKAAGTSVETEKTRADEGAAREIRDGEQQASKVKRDAEAKAEQEKQKAKQESSGFLGWLGSKAKEYVDKVKAGIKRAMNELRAAVKAKLEAAKKAAVERIEKARQAIVAEIRSAGEKLIAVSDEALAAFPGLKAKFQTAVRKTVADTEDAVNKAADGLKKDVTERLNKLGEYLDKGLGLLEKGLLAAVDGVATVVDGALKAAAAVAQAVGSFAQVIKDIAAGPKQWITNLGAAVVDGIRNHLLKAMKTAISGWFKSKVEEVLGLPIELMKALFKGGLDLGKIGKMAWAALKTAVPVILIQLLIEKLVAMIVPAAGAVMTIIEGLQAAWPTVGRIFSAVGAFLTFLKAVKGGGAGPQFAALVASAAVVVIDFVANWLLRRLIKPAKKVGGQLAAIARKILATIKKGLKKVGKGLKKLGKKIKKALKKLGKKKGKRKKDKRRDQDKNREKERKKQERLEKAVKAIEPQLNKLLRKGVSGLYLRARLVLWQARYRLSKLQLKAGGSILAVVNPTHTLSNGREIDGKRIGRVLQPIFAEAEREYLEALLKKPGMQQQHDTASSNFAAGNPNALAGTHPAVSSSVMAGTQAPSGRHESGKPDTSVFVPDGAQGAGQIKVNNIGKYDEILKGLRKNYPAVGEEKIAQILSTADPQKRQALLDELKSSGGTKAAATRRERFLRSLNRTAFLLHELEPARSPGVRASTAISHSLAAGGHVAVADVVGSKGIFATMQMTDVSARDDTQARREARSESKARTGNIAIALLQVAENSKPIYALGGYDLADLANAIRRLLESQFVHQADPEIQARQIAAVKTQIRLLLNSFHGD